MKKKTHEEYVAELKIKNPNIEVLGKYINCKTKVLHKCLDCDYKWNVVPSSLLLGFGCPKCGTKRTANKLAKSHEQFVSELSKVNERILVIGKYCNMKEKIDVKCAKCDGVWSATPDNLVNKGTGCPYCGHRGYGVFIGVNDLWTQNPNVANWLLNPDDGYKYSKRCATKVDWKCPNCGLIVKNKSICNISKRNKVPCKICSDGTSYPEKFMFSLLMQLNIEFETEKSFSWGYINIDNKSVNVKYDFYFELNNQKYVAESDGLFHFITNNMSGQTYEKSQLIDSMKDKLAMRNNVFPIRIDCRFSDIEYIKNNILNSELSKIFNLNDIDWIKCHTDGLSSYKAKSAKLWNDGKTIGEIADTMKKSYGTISKWLKDCSIAGLCNYDAKRAHSNYILKYGSNNKIKVCCIDTGCIYESITEASISTGVGANYITLCCKGVRENIKGYHWKYVL